jgi:hypothetical protein
MDWVTKATGEQSQSMTINARFQKSKTKALCDSLKHNSTDQQQTLYQKMTVPMGM